MSRLPFLPGYTFADPAKRTFRKSHLIDRSGGVTVVSDGAGTWNEKKKVVAPTKRGYFCLPSTRPPRGRFGDKK